MAKYVKVFNFTAKTTTCTNPHCTLLSLWLVYLSATLPSRHGQKQLPAPTHTATLLSLWLVPFCIPPQPTWPETTTCSSPHCHSPFSLVGTFLHPSSANMARNNYLHQRTLPLSFLFGWYLSSPLPSQHGQKQQPAPTHTDTLLSLWLVPFRTPPLPTWPKTTTCTNPHCHSPFSLVGVPFCGLAGWGLGCRTLLRGANTWQAVFGACRKKTCQILFQKNKNLILLLSTLKRVYNT